MEEELNVTAGGVAQDRPTNEAAQPPIEANRAEDIRIEQAQYGYIVDVGCQRFVFEKKERLIEKLTGYLNDPIEVRKNCVCIKK